MPFTHFTAENVRAVLEAAPYGSTHEDVLARADNPVCLNTLANWLRKGRRDVQDGKRTGYGIFAGQWDALYRPARRSVGLENARMQAVAGALDAMGIPLDDADGAIKYCECGKPRKASALACDDCQELDSRASRNPTKW